MKKRFNAKAIMIGLASLAAGAAVSVPALVPGQALAATEAVDAASAAEATGAELVTEIEKKTVVWTIRALYKSDDGSTKPVKTSDGSDYKVTRSATFTRTVTKDKATGKVVSAGAWADPVKLADFDAPSISGFTPDKTKVAGITVSYNSSPEDTIIYYTENPENKKTTISESKEVKRKITYYRVNDDGSVSQTWSKTQTVTFSRVGTVDGNGKKSYNPWQPYTWEAEAVSYMAGYTPDITTIPSVTFTPENPPKDVAVYYRKNAEDIIDSSETRIKADAISWDVVFTDGFGKVLSEVEVKDGQSAEAPKNPTKEGYTFSGWDKAFDKVTGNLTIAAKWIKNKTEWITESKTVKRTINYLYNDGTPVIATDGKPAVESDTATFNRMGLKDLVTGKITQWTDWSQALKFEARKTLTVDGYNASMTVIPEATVSADTGSWTVNVYYGKKNSGKTDVKPAAKNGLVYENGSWIYYQNNSVNKSFEGLTYCNSAWWYVKNGKLDKSYTGLSYCNGAWWYVSNGKLDKSYTGLSYYNNTWWYVKNGKLDKTFTGLSFCNSAWWYVKNGKLDKSFSGSYKFNNKTYTVVNGKAI